MEYEITVTMSRVESRQAVVKVAAKNEKEAAKLACAFAAETPEKLTWTEWPMEEYYIRDSCFSLEFGKNALKGATVNKTAAQRLHPFNG